MVGNSHKTRDCRHRAVKARDEEYHGQMRQSAIFRQRRDFLAAPVEDATRGSNAAQSESAGWLQQPCSFCIIPSVRGRSRSAPLESVVRAGAAISQNDTAKLF